MTGTSPHNRRDKGNKQQTTGLLMAGFISARGDVLPVQCDMFNTHSSPLTCAHRTMCRPAQLLANPYLETRIWLNEWKPCTCSRRLRVADQLTCDIYLPVSMLRNPEEWLTANVWLSQSLSLCVCIYQSEIPAYIWPATQSKTNMIRTANQSGIKDKANDTLQQSATCCYNSRRTDNRQTTVYNAPG